MNKIYEIMGSPAWWITVVIAGIVINLVSSYLRNVLDSRLSKLFTWWRYRSREKVEYERQYVERLKNDEKFLALHSIRHGKSMLWAIMWSLVGVMAFLSIQIFKGEELGSGLIFILAMGSIAFFRSFQHLLTAIRYWSYAERAIDPHRT